MNEICGVNDLALSIVILLSAAGGALIGIIVYLFLEERSYADHEDSTTVHSENRGHRGGAAGGGEMLGGWESCSVLPLEAQGQLASDRYTNRS